MGYDMREAPYTMADVEAVLALARRQDRRLTGDRRQAQRRAGDRRGSRSG